MRFIEMGSASHPALLFIHGLAATAESCYGEVGRLLEKDWRVVLCELDGHYDGSPPFPGLDATCAQIEAYVTERCQGRLRGMVGLSLGGTIAVTILSRGNVQIDRTVLDAAFCVDMGLLRGFYNLIFPMGVGRIRDGKYVPGFVIDGLMGNGMITRQDYDEWRYNYPASQAALEQAARDKRRREHKSDNDD